jgi:stearoyl-CoA desaturase (delta-9 desaturase)
MTASTVPTASTAPTLCWKTTLVFICTCLATFIGVPLFGYFYHYTAFDWTLLGILYIVTGMGITVGYHRMISHRSFACHPWVRIVLLIMGGWALQNSALLWCADHIRHHAHTDEEADPYNAKKGFWHSHVGWLFHETTFREDRFASKLKHDPMILWQHRYYWGIVASGLILPFVAGYVINGGLVGALSCFLLAGVLRIVLVLNSTFTINSLCHMVGAQPHGTQDSSRDSWLISFISFGEGYHNYHHTYSHDYRNGPKWYNFDPSKWLIYALSLVGLTYDLSREKV